MGIADRYPENVDEQYLNKAAQATQQKALPAGAVSGGAVGAGQYAQPAYPTPPVQDYDPTVAEFLSERIQMLQSEIKGVERRYMEARQLGILNCKTRALRDMLGW